MLKQLQLHLLNLSLFFFDNERDIKTTHVIFVGILGFGDKIAKVSTKLFEGVDVGDVMMFSLDASATKKRVGEAIFVNADEGLEQMMFFAEFGLDFECCYHNIVYYQIKVYINIRL